MKTTLLTATIAAALFAPALLPLRAQQPARPGALPVSDQPNATPLRPTTSPAPAAVMPTPSLTSRPARLERQGGSISISSDGTLAGSASTVPPLVIRFSSEEGQDVAPMEEDLAIMSRLFEKSLDQLGETPAVSKLGIQMMLTGGGRSVRASYVEGFGALFMIKVSFPVLGTATTAENKSVRVDESEWEKARRDLAGGGKARMEYSLEAGSQYDPAFVANLKQSLIKTLNNASHIRQLKPEEFIAVTVFGSPSAPVLFGSVWTGSGASGFGAAQTTPEAQNTPTPKNADKAAKFGDTFAFSYSKDAQKLQRGSVLTLRVKRADVDAFAKGELTADQFESRVSTHAYAGSGYGVTSLNSWVTDALPSGNYPPMLQKK